MAFKAAICPSCGGNLQVPDDRDSVKCMYCGTDIIVRQAIQAGAGINIENYLSLAVTATKSGNYQEAYNYYSKVLEIDINNPEAWFGKGRSAGWLSTLSDFRFGEMHTGFQNSLNNIPDKDRIALQIQCASVVEQVAMACYNISRKHILEYSSVEGTWEEYLSQSSNIIDILEFGISLDPNNQNILYGIIHICKENIEGVQYTDYSNQYEPTLVRSISAEYEKVLKGKMEHYTIMLKQVDPSFKPPEIKKKSPCCFVITATMGYKNHPYVLTLQDFRESWLLKRGYGRKFNYYYQIFGPSLANIIRDRWILRAMSLHLIVRPSVWVASKCLNKQKIKN